MFYENPCTNTEKKLIGKGILGPSNLQIELYWNGNEIHEELMFTLLHTAMPDENGTLSKQATLKWGYFEWR